MSQHELQLLVKSKQRGLIALANLGDTFLSTPWKVTSANRTSFRNLALSTGTPEVKNADQDSKQSRNN